MAHRTHSGCGRERALQGRSFFLRLRSTGRALRGPPGVFFHSLIERPYRVLIGWFDETNSGDITLHGRGAGSLPMREALQEIQKLDCVTEPPVLIRVEGRET